MTTPVNNIENKLNIVESAKANLLYQFKDLPNINNLVEVFTDELQSIENEVIKLLTLRTIEEASGQQLDDIGAVLKVTRVTSDDEIYRNLLKIRNARQTSTGHVESVLTLLRLFTGDTSVSLYKGLGYFVDVTLDDSCNPQANNPELIRGLFPVVTALRVVTTTGDPFGFEGDTSTAGFGSIYDAGAGGNFVSLLITDDDI